MTEIPRSFDWLAFATRVIVIATLTSVLLAERLHRQDHLGAAMVAGIGYVVLPVVAYFLTRYRNSWFMFGIVETVKRRISGQKDRS